MGDSGVQRVLGQPQRLGADVGAPGVEESHRQQEAGPTSPMTWSSGTHASSKNSSLGCVSEMFHCTGPRRNWSLGTRKAVIPPAARLSGSVTAKTTATSALSPLVM